MARKSKTSDLKQKELFSKILEQGTLLTMKDDLLRFGAGKLAIGRKTLKEEIVQESAKEKIAKKPEEKIFQKAPLPPSFAKEEKEKKEKEPKSKKAEKKEEIEENKEAKSKEAEEKKEEEIVEQIKRAARQREAILRAKSQAKKQEKKREEEEKRKAKESEEAIEARKREQEGRIIERIRSAARQREAILEAKRRAEEDERRREEITRQVLEEKLDELNLKLNTFPAKRKPLEMRKIAIQKEKEDFLKTFSSVVEKERKLNDEKEALEAEESTVKDPEQRHQIEKKRWAIEEKLRKVEKEKWQQEDKLKQKDAKIRQIEKSLEEFSSEERKLKRFKDEVLRQLKELEVKKERKQLMDELELYKVKIDSFLRKEARLEQEKEETDKTLSIVLRREQELERKEDEIVEKEKEAVSLAQERELEKERWGIEDKRRSVPGAGAAFSQGKNVENLSPKEAAIKKISSVSSEEEERRKKFLSRVFGEGEESVEREPLKNKEKVVFRPIVKQPSALERFFVRLIIVFVVLGLIAGAFFFVYAYIYPKKPIKPLFKFFFGIGHSSAANNVVLVLQNSREKNSIFS